MSNLTKLIPVPATINSGKSSCNTRLLVSKYGPPTKRLTSECKNPTSKFWLGRMVTQDVGPFRVTGHIRAVELLGFTLKEVGRKYPELYKALSSAGMLCVRHVRGVPGVMSNHSLGLAIDFKIEGLLDPYGDGKCQQGLLDLYSVMKQFGWFWGASFRKEDAMHFEVSQELIDIWIREGQF